MKTGAATSLGAAIVGAIVLVVAVSIAVGVLPGAEGAAESALETPTPTVEPPLGATELVAGPPVELPPGTAIIFSTACRICVGGDKLYREYRRQDGTFAETEVLFDPVALGITRTSQYGPGAANLMGVAASPDGHEIVVGVCTRGTCGYGPAELNGVTGFRSTDGGLTWSKYFEVTNSDPTVRGVSPKGAVVAGEVYSPTYLPSGERINFPPGVEGSFWALGDGTPLSHDPSNIVRQDGSTFAPLLEVPGYGPAVLQAIAGESEEHVIMAWERFGALGIQYTSYSSTNGGEASLEWTYLSDRASWPGPQLDENHFLVEGLNEIDTETGTIHPVAGPQDDVWALEPVALQRAPLPTANPMQPEVAPRNGGPPSP